ncbi:MAG: L-fucose:H+ symporter permease [Pirellulales bacterium]|nr:L-fucose:H+ symporter permease [Pirellulales bacterium]
MENKPRVIPPGIILPFALLSSLFLAWAIPNNMTDTMLAAFTRIMSLTDTKSAFIQISCYFFGYGCFAIPGALFIKRFTYKSGVILGLSLYAGGAILTYGAGLAAGVSMDLCFYTYLLTLIILFAGLSILETATNSYVCAIGDPETATQRLNFAQSFNPFGAITGVVISQIFVLSQLDVSTPKQREGFAPEKLAEIQGRELSAVTTTYMVLGLVMLCLMLAILVTKMPNLKEDDKRLDFGGTFRRLMRNPRYVWGVIAQFFYVGAQIAVWSYTIRYVMVQLDLDNVVAKLGANPSKEQIIEALRQVEPIGAVFYSICDFLHINVLIPQTVEQVGNTYYLLALIMFVIMRFGCTGLMKFFKPRDLLTALSAIAVALCLITVYSKGFTGIYALVCISGCMSLMFPTIYGMGIAGLGEDTKIGGSGMVMAIAGAAVLTQIQGAVSDQTGSIKLAYLVPAVAFIVIGFYGAVICRRYDYDHSAAAG